MTEQLTGTAPAADTSDLEARQNISEYHREHMRFYVMTQLEVAADLVREANKLKVYGVYWQKDQSAVTPSFDGSNPKYAAAGAPDLTPLDAITGMGILFMEGEGEPDEIRLLREKLSSLSHRFVSKGTWLVDKMEKAWQRESVLLTPATADAAFVRMQVIAVDWQGATETVLVGRLISLARETLDEIDFTPATIRADPSRYGEMLLRTGWVLDLASRQLAKLATDLSKADPGLTKYLSLITRRDG